MRCRFALEREAQFEAFTYESISHMYSNLIMASLEYSLPKSRSQRKADWNLDLNGKESLDVSPAVTAVPSSVRRYIDEWPPATRTIGHPVSWIEHGRRRIAIRHPRIVGCRVRSPPRQYNCWYHKHR